jgi:hypothetical protein
MRRPSGEAAISRTRPSRPAVTSVRGEASGVEVEDLEGVVTVDVAHPGQPGVVEDDGKPAAYSRSRREGTHGSATVAHPADRSAGLHGGRAPGEVGADGPVVPVAEEFPLRYQDWVRDRRESVHARTDRAIGYLHVPDMMSLGWAQLHRDLRTEMPRDGLIVDVRGNGGGHTSQLVLEKLARRVIGWDIVRGYHPESYPSDARRGPMVAIADMFAGSDGDIITAAIQSLELGPVVGTRTWGGVIGIDGRYTLVDGTMVTQPRHSFWFEKFGWGVENHGVDPPTSRCP